MILTGVSLRKRETRKTAALRGASTLLRHVGGAVRRNALGIGVTAGAGCFIGILIGFELLGSAMGMVSLLALSLSEEGGLK